MKILHLTLKKQWFAKIAENIKKEEYRAKKPYWYTRLIEHYDTETGELLTKHFDIVRFRNGYAKDAPTMDVEFIETRIANTGNTEWGWEEPCYGIVLGKVLKIDNFKQTA